MSVYRLVKFRLKYVVHFFIAYRTYYNTFRNEIFRISYTTPNHVTPSYKLTGITLQWQPRLYDRMILIKWLLRYRKFIRSGFHRNRPKKTSTTAVVVWPSNDHLF